MMPSHTSIKQIGENLLIVTIVHNGVKLTDVNHVSILRPMVIPRHSSSMRMSGVFLYRRIHTRSCSETIIHRGNFRHQAEIPSLPRQMFPPQKFIFLFFYVSLSKSFVGGKFGLQAKFSSLPKLVFPR